MKTSNGYEVTLRACDDGTIDLQVGDQTIAFYSPYLDSWHTVGWVSETIGLLRKGSGLLREGYDPTGPVAFLP